jgi:hypothetical protein
MIYDMVEVPADNPDTTPADDTVATLGILLLHVPPAIGSVNDVVLPMHIEALPEIAAGDALTVITLVAMQPVGAAYDITAVPADTPRISPPVPADAVDAALLLHMPPVVASARVMVLPTHTLEGPVIGAGRSFTLIVNGAPSSGPIPDIRHPGAAISVQVSLTKSPLPATVPGREYAPAGVNVNVPAGIVTE